MKIEPRVAVRAVGPLIDGVRGSGGNPRPLLQQAGLGDCRFDDPDARVPMAAVAAFLHLAAAALADDS